MFADSADLSSEARQQIITRRLQPALSATLDQMDESALRDYPWLLLHQGWRQLRLHSDFARARPYIDGALAAFRDLGDGEGEAWSLVEWVVLRHHLHESATGLTAARWSIAAAEHDLRSPYLRSELLFGCTLCLMDLGKLAEAVAHGEAVLALLEQEPDPWLQHSGRVQILRTLAVAYHSLGHMRRAVEMAATATRLAREQGDIAAEPWCHYELGLLCWRSGDFAQAAQALDTARRQTEQWRHHELWCWAVAVQGHMLRDQNELAAAHEAYRLAESWGEDIHGPVFLFIREGKLAEARWGCQALLRLASEIGSPIYEADGRVLLALIELRAGQTDRALEEIDRAIQVFTERNYGYNLISARLYRAAILLCLKRYAEADADLTAGMAAMAREQIYNCDWWMPDLIELVLLRSLQQRIEPTHTQRLLNRRFLNPLPTLATISAATSRALHSSAELEIARQTQINLLPSTPPLMPNLDIAGLSLPAEEVGGDFYGYYLFGVEPSDKLQRQVALALGDISGKGLQSALLTSGTVVALTTAVVDHPSPTQLLSRVHTALHPFTTRSRMNVSLCYSILSQGERSWTLRVANAGAISPLIRRADGSIIWIEATGLPLGTTYAAEYAEVVADLAPGDLLLLLSDGVVEAMNPSGELFGFERLEQALIYAPIEHGAQAVVGHLLTVVQTHVANARQHDDMTLVTVLVQAGYAA